MKTKTVVLYIVVLYAVLTVAFYFLVERHAYEPPHPGYKDQAGIIKLTTENGAKISAVYLPNPAAEYTFLVSHGNAEDLAGTMPFLRQLQAHGFAAFAYDYEGYGTSSGRPSERGVYQDVQAAYDYLTKQLGIPANRIIAYGHSLGAAAAIDLASKRPVAGVVVESGFVSVLRVLTRYPIFLFDRFNNLAKIKQIHAPVLVIQGKQDKTIPFYHGEQLYKAANCPKEFLWIDDAGHNDVEEKGGKQYWEKLQNISILAALLDKVKRQMMALQ